MSSPSSVRLPLGLLAAAGLLTVLLLHAIAYASTYGLGGGLADVMREGGHDGYWVPLVVGAALAFIGAVAATRSRAQFAALAAGEAPTPTWRLAAWTTAAIMAMALVGFLVLENVERAAAGRGLVGVSPLGLLATPVGAVLGGAAVAMVAVLTVLAISVRRRQYERTLTASYASLVDAGVYTASFQQPEWARTFVGQAVDAALARSSSPAPRVLEVGCGTGVWLEVLARRAGDRTPDLHGFDLSDAMIEEARVRLQPLGLAGRVRVGDVFEAGSYAFEGSDEFDLVYCYDVVQQLPGDAQEAAVEAMLRAVGPTGSLIVFDQDAKSRIGRQMGLKKWARRYLRLPLVPAFYIHSRYPNLGRLSRRLAASGIEVALQVEPGGRKRALVVRPTSPGPAAGPTAGSAPA